MTDTHDTITNEPLKPCPFCGGKASAIEVLNYNATAVRCDKCHASSGNCDTEEEAIAAWNRRDGEAAWKREKAAIEADALAVGGFVEAARKREKENEEGGAR